MRDLPGRQFPFKDLEDSQRLLESDSQALDPPAGEVVKCIFTTLTSKPFAGNSLDSVASTSTAETTVVFLT